MKLKKTLTTAIAIVIAFVLAMILSTQEAKSDFDQPIIPSASTEGLALVPTKAVHVPEPVKPAAPASVKEMVAQAFPDAPVMLAVADAESKYNPHAKNPRSTATGVFQILIGTWEHYQCEGSRTDASDNIECARKIYDREGTRPWASSGPW